MLTWASICPSNKHAIIYTSCHSQPITSKCRICGRIGCSSLVNAHGSYPETKMREYLVEMLGPRAMIIELGYQEITSLPVLQLAKSRRA